MPNLKTVLVRLCKTPEGWKRFPVVYGKNGRIKPDAVLVHGRERDYPVGRYQVRWYEGRKTTYRDVGDHPMEALAALRQQSQLLLARDAAEGAGVTINEEQKRIVLFNELGRFVESTRDRGSLVAANMYNAAAREFLETVGKTYADELDLDDLVKFRKALKDRGCADRTIHNRHANVLSFLRWCKLDVKALSPARHRPKFEKTIPEVYSPEDMKKLFDSIKDPKLYNGYQILLKCGLREQEAMYLEWSNVDLIRGVLRVVANPRFGFRVKDGEQRAVPFPQDLQERLKEYREKHPGERLVTGTKSDKPNPKLLRTLKRLVNRAGLQCGSCEGCLTQKQCSLWFLHKFRATCITFWLRSGMDLRTVMKLSGHSDMESVMRYLSPAGDDAVREHVNSIKWEG